MQQETGALTKGLLRQGTGVCFLSSLLDVITLQVPQPEAATVT